MTRPWATLGGERLTTGRVYVPGVGVWYAEVEMEGAPSLSGRQTLVLGNLQLVGTIDETESGTSEMVAGYRLVGGGGGWSRVLPARSYHSDSGVRASTVAEDAAREAGETLGTFSPGSTMVGADYVRGSAPGNVTLADVAGGVPWWLDFDGVTHVEARSEIEAERGTYEVQTVAPEKRLVTLAVDDLTRVGIGSILTERLDAPMVIRSMEIEIDGSGSVRVHAWCGAPSTSESLGPRSLRSIFEHIASDRLLGVWTYQVVRQGTDGRLELQPVERSAGLPDIGPVAVWPGIAGASAEVRPGTQVLVEFLNGDRRKPLVRGFVQKGGENHEPLALVLAAQNAIKLASGTAADGVAKSSACNDRFDDIALALDFLCSYVPASPGPGAGDVTALLTAFKAVWNPSAPAPTPPANVGSDKVFVP